jgi:hypothetical protein
MRLANNGIRVHRKHAPPPAATSLLGNNPVTISVGRKVIVSAERSVAVLGKGGKKVFIPRWALKKPDAGAGDMISFIEMSLGKAHSWGILAGLGKEA